MLSIAPSLELKQICTSGTWSARSTINRTIFGIETHNNAEHPQEKAELSIAPSLELKLK